MCIVCHKTSEVLVQEQCRAPAAADLRKTASSTHTSPQTDGWKPFLKSQIISKQNLNIWLNWPKLWLWVSLWRWDRLLDLIVSRNSSKSSSAVALKKSETANNYKMIWWHSGSMLDHQFNSVGFSSINTSSHQHKLSHLLALRGQMPSTQ